MKRDIVISHIGFLTVFFLLSILFLGRAIRGTVTEYGYGDDDDYWSYGRSFVYNGNFDFSHEPLPTFVQNPGRKNYHSPIPSVMWLPAIALGRVMGPIYHFWKGAGADGWETGSSSLNRLLVSAYSSALVYAGLIGLYWFLLKLFEPSIAFQGAVISLWGTPLMFFAWRRPLMAHSSEYVLLVASALSLYELFHRPSLLKAFLTGFVLSLAVFVRYPNLFTVSAMTGGCFWQWEGWKKCRWIHIGAAAVGGFLPVVFQIAVWHSVYGTFFPLFQNYATSQKSVGGLFVISWFTVKGIREVLAGSDWGLIWLEPAFLVATLGTICFWKPLAKLRILLLAALLVHLVIAANFGDQGGSYGYRYMLIKVIWLSINYALCLSLIRKQSLQWGLTILCCLFSIIPFLLYASGPPELTLHLLPSRVPGFSDWINNRFLINVWSTMRHHPLQLIYGISGAPLMHGVVAVFAKTITLSFLPNDIREKILSRLTGVPWPDLVWFVAWQMIFVGFFYLLVLKWLRFGGDKRWEDLEKY